jgi:predicted GH43/DUF377 family glycosyl hydrolase
MQMRNPYNPFAPKRGLRGLPARMLRSARKRIRKIRDLISDLDTIFQNSLLRLASYPTSISYTLKVDEAPYAFNPSLVRVADGFLSFVRDTNQIVVSDGQSGFYLSYPHRTENYVFELRGDLSTKGCRKFKLEPDSSSLIEAENGLEDIRLFSFGGKLYGIGAGIRDAGRNPSEQREIKQILFTLDALGNVLDRSVLNSPLGYPVEKNWMPFEHNSELHIVYSVDPLTILKIQDNQLIQLDGQPLLKKFNHDDMEYRGSTNGIPFRGGYLFIIHNRRRYGKKNAYIHYFMFLDRELRLIQISEPFLFDRPGIEFAINMVEVGDRVLISYGIADRQSRVISVHADRVGDLIGIS